MIELCHFGSGEADRLLQLLLSLPCEQTDAYHVRLRSHEFIGTLWLHSTFHSLVLFRLCCGFLL